MTPRVPLSREKGQRGDSQMAMICFTSYAERPEICYWWGEWVYWGAYIPDLLSHPLTRAPYSSRVQLNFVNLLQFVHAWVCCLLFDHRYHSVMPHYPLDHFYSTPIPSNLLLTLCANLPSLSPIDTAGLRPWNLHTQCSNDVLPKPIQPRSHLPNKLFASCYVKNP